MRALAPSVLLLLAAVTAAQEPPSQVCDKLVKDSPAKPTPISRNACANGDFEPGLDGREWFGRHGVVTHNGDPVFFNTGLFGGAHGSCDAHQTLVETGPDDVAPIRTVAPGGSTRAVRIGNSVWNARADLLGKTFVVEASQSVISFSYAFVFQDPAHKPQHQPSFTVRVLDAEGHEIPGVVDLGRGLGTNKLVAPGGTADPFFTDVPGRVPLTRYRDWTCGVIDLSAHAGKTVTVEFIVEDCALGGHYAYAYIDNFCSGGACGPSVTLASAPECGPGRICFRYTRATAHDPDPAVTLDLLQGGMVKRSLAEPLVIDDLLCFEIDKAVIDALDPAREFFDFVATTNFGVIGAPGEGITPGIDNDYRKSCGPPGCCPGTFNLIANGDFELGNTGFTSDYDHRAAPYGEGSVRPRQYAVVDAAEAASIAATWRMTCPAGRFLVVNGETCATGSRKVWSQTVSVTPGATYRFCAKAARLPQPAFDRTPEVELRFTSPLGTVTKVVETGCWTTIDTDITIPPGVTSITCEIWLRDDELGDGNDLALDDIALHELKPGDPSLAEFEVVRSEIENGTYTITATPSRGQPHPAVWEVCETDDAGDCIDATWTLGTVAPAGPFEASKSYRITYAVDDPCADLVTSTYRLTRR